MNPAGITLLMLAAFAGFFYLAWRKVAIIVALAPETRWDRPLSRARRVVKNGLLQSRMIRGERKPGIMHAVIFAGFLALLARKLQLIVIGYDEAFVYPGALGAAFVFGKDLVEVAVLVAVGYALFRRLVQKPARLERNREALVILALIAAIMVSDLLFDGFRFALAAEGDAGIAHEARYAVIGSAIAGAFAGVGKPALGVGYQIAYWVQMVTVLAFLVLLPVGEHFHIVTALPALFFARTNPVEPGAERGPRQVVRGYCRRRNENRRAHGGRSRLEGRARRLHLHRMRPVQGCVSRHFSLENPWL